MAGRHSWSVYQMGNSCSSDQEGTESQKSFKKWVSRALRDRYEVVSTAELGGR